MLMSVLGIYHNGWLELSEEPPVSGDRRVIVTFLAEDAEPEAQPTPADAEFAEQRRRHSAGEEDWSAPMLDRIDDL